MSRDHESRFAVVSEGELGGHLCYLVSVGNHDPAFSSFFLALTVHTLRMQWQSTLKVFFFFPLLPLFENCGTLYPSRIRERGREMGQGGEVTFCLTGSIYQLSSVS